MENWKDIKGYEGLYLVSNIGRVKSLPRTIQKSDGRTQPVFEKILTPSTDKDGYKITTLFKGKKRKMLKVHRVVAEAFITNLENKPQVNHINGIKDDNRIENLEWSTISENRQHAYDNGLQNGALVGVVGSNHPTAVGVIKFDLQGNKLKEYGSVIEAQKDTSILTQNICAAAKGKAKTAGGFIWKYVKA